MLTVSALLYDYIIKSNRTQKQQQVPSHREQSYGHPITSENGASLKSPADIPNQVLLVLHTYIMEHAPRMDWISDNLAEAFRRFEQRLQLFFKVKKVREAEQVSLILLQVGEEGLRRFNSWTLTEEEEADPAIILQKFKAVSYTHLTLPTRRTV